MILVILSCQHEPYQQGKRLYTYYCANCHMEDGSGLARLIPALTDESYLIDQRKQLSCIVKYGISGPIVVNDISYNFNMAGFSHLSDAEISNIVNYVLSEWAPKEPPMLPQEVAKTLENCAESTK